MHESPLDLANNTDFCPNVGALHVRGPKTMLRGPLGFTQAIFSPNNHISQGPNDLSVVGFSVFLTLLKLSIPPALS